MGACLNAPYGARCFLTRYFVDWEDLLTPSLNAPYGARCFLTHRANESHGGRGTRLNAPYGARCFLTRRPRRLPRARRERVLMHLMALGAF